MSEMDAVEQMYRVEADRLAGTQVILGSSVRQGPSDGRSVVESEGAPPVDTEDENPLADSKVDIEEEWPTFQMHKRTLKRKW